ncbi:Endo/exonuclease/phosphatase domain-containing protein [Aphis craccivora]|uniref:Endo/exonuclease/phosphatase domain-containing protein n=1 Tax=Aphis craccivora TaxID=307492 RepID=A0A6G0YGX7_APHCR|nr:Endo/exonuclease/phosphatase domain-containing protein [Aphis craccivora]
MYFNLDIKITSPITALKAGFKLDKFAHITSFRRQLYINPEDFFELPGPIAITSDNTTYRIFITDDTLTCFLCKRTGHVSSSCKTTYTIYSGPRETISGRQPKFVRSRAFPQLNSPKHWPPSTRATDTVTALPICMHE